MTPGPRPSLVLIPIKVLAMEGNFKDGKTMSVKAWKPNGEKCPVTNVKDGSGVVVVYNEGGTESGRQTFKDGELVFD